MIHLQIINFQLKLRINELKKLKHFNNFLKNNYNFI